MSQMFLRALTASALLVTAVGCAGDPVGTSNEVMGDAAASLHTADPKTPYEVNRTSLLLAPGATEQLAVTRTANGEPVPPTSVVWSSSDDAVATVSDAGLVTAVAPGDAIISVTRGAHRLDVAVTVSGCAVGPLPAGTIQGEVTSTDCVFPNGRYADFFSVSTTPGQIIEFMATGLAGSFGYREASADPVASRLYGAVAINGAPIRIISNGTPFNVYVSGSLGVTGGYSLVSSAPTEPHHCDVFNFILPGTSFSATVTEANACHYEVQYSPVPEAIGKPLAAHGFNILLTELKSYTVTITGLTDSFDPALTIFGPNGVHAQAAPGPLPSPGTRSVAFTPSQAGYYYIEISGGRFIDDLETWDKQMGTYHLTVSP